MLTFRQFILENELIDDNPSDRWEKDKQEEAERAMKERKGRGHLGKGLVGDPSARWKEPVKIPVEHIKNLKGSADEHEYRHKPDDSKTRHLEQDVGHPSKFNTRDHPLDIRVNHKGEAFVHNGNHRLEYAKRHGITHVHAYLQYHAGGEKAKGVLHPDNVRKMQNE